MAEEKVSRKKRYEPTDDDYEISRISIEEAENGVVIECSYNLKDEVKDKMKSDEKSGLGYYDSYCPPERHVFEKESEAKAFIIDELNSLWADIEEDKTANPGY